MDAGLGPEIDSDGLVAARASTPSPADDGSAGVVHEPVALWCALREGYASSWLGRISLIMAASFLVTFVTVALLRLRYPFELEWIEGGLLDAMRRVRAGQGLY